MLKLRRAIVLDVGSPGSAGEQDLVIELVDEAHDAEGGAMERGADAGGEQRRRPAIADVALVGRAEIGDELVVNVQARDLGLGSGGFDIVHVNLSRGLGAEEDWDPALPTRPNVMKLNYTSLQHTVEPVEELGGASEHPVGVVGLPVAVLALHGQLAAVAWAFSQARPASRLGYVQTAGGALPGGHSRTVRSLRERGLLVGHLTAGAAFGGEGEAITTVGALDHGLRVLGWDAAICGPGPGIVGSSSPLGHGGMSALDSAHAALALGASTLLVARMSSGDPRARHRGISHHTLTVLDLLLEPVTVALPAGMRSPVGRGLRWSSSEPPSLGARCRATDHRSASTHHPPRLAPSDRRSSGLRRRRSMRRDDGPWVDRGSVVLRRRACGRHDVGRARGGGRSWRGRSGGG